MNRSARVTLMVAGSIAAIAQVATAGPWQLGMASRGRWMPVVHSRPGTGNTWGGAMDTFPFTENFDSYATGPVFPCATPAPNCTGSNGFGLWVVAETSTGGTAGPNNGTITTAHPHTAPNCVQLAPAVDIVQYGNLTTGKWKFSMQTYVTSGTSGLLQDKGYLIVLNNYQPPTSPTNNNQWSIQVGLNKVTGLLTDFNTNVTYGSLIRDQWVLVEIIIDIDADTYQVNYNGATAWGPIPYSTASGFGQGLHAIQCLDLFSDDGTGIFLDDVSLTQIVTVTCYPNCDSSTTVPCLNVLDFSCFLNEFAAGHTYANCDHSTTVPVLNVLDFSCFLNSFAAGCSSC